MHAVTVTEMRALEEAVFRAGTDPGDLMDRAGLGIARRLLDHFPRPGRAVGYLGKGNNAGDALVVLAELREQGWRVALRSAHPETERTTLSRQRGRRLDIAENTGIPHGPGPLLLLDGLLGIGAAGAPRAPLDTLAAEMEALRRDHGAIVVGIDLPSGIDGDSGEAVKGVVTADLTVTVGAPKRGLLADAAVNHVGRLLVVPLDELQPPEHNAPLPAQPGSFPGRSADVPVGSRDPVLVTPESFPGLLTPRSHDFHKGHAGRVAVLAGAPGMSGAATLAATGALRGGGGLVTLFLDPDNPARPTPEIMVRHSARRIAHAFEFQADAFVIGPGLGQFNDPHRDTLFGCLADDDRPAVLDADALNLIAAAKRTDLLRGHHLITPHPGEFARLAPDLAEMPRVEAATRFVERHPCTLLLKGARTVIAAPGSHPRINPTGHAGMASGGQGDVLAGVCGALLGAGLAPVDAATLGAWLCGRAAERALTHGGESEQSLTAGDTLTHLGGAFVDWRERRR